MSSRVLRWVLSGSTTLVLACAAGPMQEPAITPQPIAGTVTMLYAGGCHFLACCGLDNCALPDTAVTGECGSGCSEGLWIMRPDGDPRYQCGQCVRVCSMSGVCANATVWSTSVTSGIEGSAALFDTLGLARSEDVNECTGTGEELVTVKDC